MRDTVFEEKGRATHFAVLDTKGPVEEVSAVGESVFAGEALRIISTTRVRIGKGKEDRQTTMAIIAAENGEIATYTSKGKVVLKDHWKQEGSGTIAFSTKSKGKLAPLNALSGRFHIRIDEDGSYKLTVWKTTPKRPRVP